MAESKQHTPAIDPQALRDRVSSGEAIVIVDVRSPEEFAAAHVEGAINIPEDQLSALAGDFPSDANIVTACNLGGSRSCRAAEQLRDLGFGNAAALSGGLRGWLEGDAAADDVT